MYENYVFDLYGTLVDIHTDEEESYVWEKLSLFFGYYGANYEPKELNEKYHMILKEKEHNEIQKSDAHEAYPEIELTTVFAELFRAKNCMISEELAQYTGQFFRALSTEYVKLYDGAKELLEALRNAGKKVYLLSNAQRIFTAYELSYLGIDDCFDAIYISSDYGTKKPDQAFFERLIKEQNLDVKKSLMIGNDLRCDIAGGASVGMDTLYIHSNISPELKEEPKATYCFMEMDLEEVRKELLQ